MNSEVFNKLEKIKEELSVLEKAVPFVTTENNYFHEASYQLIACLYQEVDPAIREAKIGIAVDSLERALKNEEINREPHRSIILEKIEELRILTNSDLSDA